MKKYKYLDKENIETLESSIDEQGVETAFRNLMLHIAVDTLFNEYCTTDELEREMFDYLKKKMEEYGKRRENNK